jgi:cytoplasmic iron level regulating protein YaaA (DUF328/UPF0246 family)
VLIVLSPSKTLELGPPGSTSEMSQPVFAKEAAQLAGYLKKFSLSQLEEVMKISTKLALLNQERIALWKPEFTIANARQAIYSFRGEVYHGIDIRSMLREDVEDSQQHLRILSGLNGVLRPLDLIQPYRLEMGTSCQFGKYKDLYHFWRPKITRQICSDLKESGSNLLVNLASQEYFSAIEIKKLKAQIVTPRFLEEKNGSFSMVTVYAKKARGMMTRYIIQNRITRVEDLHGFDSDGYYFNSYLSKPGLPVFTR